jgi:hypothetical protein
LLSSRQSPYFTTHFQRSPKYNSEGVYPAYWQDEPLSLILAKKQYELVKGGMDEEAAYEEAEKFAEKFEQDAYEELVTLTSALGEKGARLPATANKEVAAEIARWKRILSKHNYAKLSDADQGEIDYLLQTKILKWNQVERDRRMADPIFTMQFETLRDYIFPEIGQSRRKEFHGEYNRDMYKSQQLSVFGIPTATLLQTSSPFFYEDYVYYFNRLKDQPFLAKWNPRSREKFSRWIIDSLGIKHKVGLANRGEVQAYLDNIRAQFFPMIRQPHRVKEFNLPSAELLRTTLYNNDIGYKTDNGKLFVFRFYRLPMLLFPKETLTTVFTSDHDKLR